MASNMCAIPLFQIYPVLNFWTCKVPGRQSDIKRHNTFRLLRPLHPCLWLSDCCHQVLYCELTCTGMHIFQQVILYPLSCSCKPKIHLRRDVRLYRWNENCFSVNRQLREAFYLPIDDRMCH